jgi:hypothetical protein
VENTVCLSGDSSELDYYQEVDNLDWVQTYYPFLIAYSTVTDNGDDGIIWGSGEAGESYPAGDPFQTEYVQGPVFQFPLGLIYTLAGDVQGCFDSSGDNPYVACGNSSADIQDFGSLEVQLNVGGTQGHINPKYIVVGVEYAPPGSSSNVSYTKDTVVGSTSSTSTSFNNKTSVSVSLSSTAGIPGFFSGKETTTTSASYAQQSGSSNTVAVSQTVSNKTGLNGYTDPVTGVNHNYDYIFVWLNPIAMYTVASSGGNTAIQFNGYGFDQTDTNVYNDLDVIGIPVGCLNGYFAATGNTAWVATCNDIASVYARTWALNNVDGSGPGLTADDLQSILQADPFYTSYTPTLAAGSYTTTDGRFTECDTSGCQQTIDFEPNVPDSYSQGYTTTTTNTKNYSHTETFAVEQQFSSSAFWNTFSLSLQTQNESTWVYSTSNSMSYSNGQTAAFTINGPAPGYTGPLQFVAFQDNYFGTFMFQP